LALDTWLPALASDTTQLTSAMRYSACGGGKRVRAILTYASAEAIGQEASESLDAVASALECVHAYSLIHDDLPSMDDDDLRRGRPSCHIAYGEAIAILAGDALQTHAFEILSHSNLALTDSIKLRLVNELALSSGAQGMVLGQAIDLSAVDQSLTQTDLEQMHSCKTGALIRASIRMGAIVASANENQLASLTRYAEFIGLAFQVQDDVLDVISDTDTLGKPKGADEAMNKPTFVSLLGLESAQKFAKNLHHQALDSLSDFDYRADNLRHLSGYIVSRSN
jgi:farnesyl diphosphate synthase/geranylgeranyl diphosphate synthase type II